MMSRQMNNQGYSPAIMYGNVRQSAPMGGYGNNAPPAMNFGGTTPRMPMNASPYGMGGGPRGPGPYNFIGPHMGPSMQPSYGNIMSNQAMDPSQMRWGQNPSQPPGPNPNVMQDPSQISGGQWGVINNPSSNIQQGNSGSMPEPTQEQCNAALNTLIRALGSNTNPNGSTGSWGNFPTVPPQTNQTPSWGGNMSAGSNGNTWSSGGTPSFNVGSDGSSQRLQTYQHGVNSGRQ